MKDVCVFVDADGALLGNGNIRQGEQGPIDLFSINSKLNEHLLQLAADPTVGDIYLLSFSFRTDPQRDWRNAQYNKSGSFFQALDIYVKKLREFSEKIHLDKIIRHDYVLKKEPGYTFNEMEKLKWINDPDLNAMPALFHESNSQLDPLKICLGFLLMWHCHQKRTAGRHLNFQIFDDRMDIIFYMAGFNQRNKKLHVPNSSIEFFQYLQGMLDGNPVYEMVKHDELSIKNDDTKTPPAFDIFNASVRLNYMLQVNDSDERNLSVVYLIDLSLESLTLPRENLVNSPHSPVNVAYTQNQLIILINLIKIGFYFSGGYGKEKMSMLALALGKLHSKELTRVLIERGADLLAIVNQEGDTIFHVLFRKKWLDLIAVCMQLDKTKCPINTANSYGYTPLHHATAIWDAALIKVFLAAGAQVNAQTEDGTTPLHIAVESKQLNLVKVLYEIGKADIHLKNKRQQSPLDIAKTHASADMQDIFEPPIEVEKAVAKTNDDDQLGVMLIEMEKEEEKMERSCCSRLTSFLFNSDDIQQDIKKAKIKKDI